MPQNNQVQVRLPRVLYTQIAALARKENRPVAREVAMAVECYLERATQGSQRWDDLAMRMETK